MGACASSPPPYENDYDCLDKTLEIYALYGATILPGTAPPAAWGRAFRCLVHAKTNKYMRESAVVPLSYMYADQVKVHGRVIRHDVPRAFVQDKTR